LAQRASQEAGAHGGDQSDVHDGAAQRRCHQRHQRVGLGQRVRDQAAEGTTVPEEIPEDAIPPESTLAPD
jgi:hypothetical protein